MPPLPVPPTNDDGSLRYYTSDELAQIDLKRIGVSGEGTHTHEDFGPDGSGATRMFSCKWEERFAAALVMVGACKSYVDGGGKLAISRLLPDSYPGLLELNWICTKVRTDPYRYMGEIADVDFGQSMPVFERAKLECTYELVPFSLIDDPEVPAEFGEMERYVTEPGFPGAEITTETSVITMPGGMLNYTTSDGTSKPAGVPIPYNVGFPETISKKKAVWRRVPKDVWGPGTDLTRRVKGDGVTRGLIGAVNKTAIWGHPPLTLKLEGVEERLLPDPRGVGYSWDLGYLMSEKAAPYGHLGLYFSDTADTGNVSGYYQVLHRTLQQTQDAATLAGVDTAPLFHVRDLRELFVPEL